MNKENFFIVSIIIVVVSFLGWIIYNNYTLGSESEDWDEVCVHGQLVYRANFAAKGMAVNVLNDDGAKVKCTVKE